MKVLFCSPFSSDIDVVKGGINTWGRYIISYYMGLINKNVELTAVSFDRRSSINEQTGLLNHIIVGVSELWRPIRIAYSMMRRNEFDVIHISTSAGLSLIKDYLLLSVARRYNIRPVVHLHFGRVPELVRSNTLEWKLLSRILNKCDKIIVMNNPSYQKLIETGFSNVYYVPNPIGQQILCKVASISDKFKRVSRRILYVGHMARAKGVYELVEACSKIPDIELRIVGKCVTSISQDLISIASSSDNPSFLTIVGEVSQEQVIEEFLTADLFVFPSYSEGFPNVILEAMACGCPIIASNVGAIPEMLDIDGEACGICVPPKSVQDVYDAVKTMIDDTTMKRICTERAMRRVNAFYSMSNVWDMIVNIWKNGNNTSDEK